jgi:hypothetical protein
VGVLKMLLDYVSLGTREAGSPAPVDNTSWIFMQPDSHVYDAEIIQVFVSLFQRYVTPKFLLFEQNQADHRKLPDALKLAMAAVGGAYCCTIGAYSVAKAIFADARRLVLTAVRGPNPDRDG